MPSTQPHAAGVWDPPDGNAVRMFDGDETGGHASCVVISTLPLTGGSRWRGPHRVVAEAVLESAQMTQQ